mgnify:CR=1 FL=1
MGLQTPEEIATMVVFLASDDAVEPDGRDHHLRSRLDRVQAPGRARALTRVGRARYLAAVPDETTLEARQDVAVDRDGAAVRADVDPQRERRDEDAEAAEREARSLRRREGDADVLVLVDLDDELLEPVVLALRDGAPCRSSSARRSTP